MQPFCFQGAGNTASNKWFKSSSTALAREPGRTHAVETALLRNQPLSLPQVAYSLGTLVLFCDHELSERSFLSTNLSCTHTQTPAALRRADSSKGASSSLPQSIRHLAFEAFRANETDRVLLFISSYQRMFISWFLNTFIKHRPLQHCQAFSEHTPKGVRLWYRDDG